jgi:hypothetical protein
MGVNRGEGVVRDLGMGSGHGGQEGRLAGIGQADQTGVGDQLEPEPDPVLLARPARVEPARCPVGGGLVVAVSEAAVATLGQASPLADLGQIGDYLFLGVVEHLGAHRNPDLQALAGAPGHALAPAVIAAAGLEVLAVAKIDQGVQALDRGDPTPPSGPPNSTYFSRRKLMQPAPPSPLLK